MILGLPISRCLISAYHTLMGIFLLPALYIFTGFEVLGRERTKGIKNPVIIIANHRSYLDPFIVGVSFGLFGKIRPIRYISMDKLFKKPLLALGLFMCGAFPAYRGQGLDKSLKKPRQILANGGPVGFFVEGNVFKERDIKKTFRGAAVLGQESNVTVIPVYTEGTLDISPRKFFSFQNQVKVIHGAPYKIPAGDVTEEFVEKHLRQKLLELQKEMDQHLAKEDEIFWNNYGKIYKYLERANQYGQLLETEKKFITLYSRPGEHWLDVGSGSGAMVELLLNKNHPVEKVVATDYYQPPLRILGERFQQHRRAKSLEIHKLDLRKKTPYRDESFDGITANLVLPYITNFEGESGRQSFYNVMKEMFRLLKPGGVLVWSTPVPNVKFSKVFLSSWKDMFNLKHPENIYYGPAILKHALTIARRGRNQIYHFLNEGELKKLFDAVGFKKFTAEKTFADQVMVISVEK